MRLQGRRNLNLDTIYCWRRVLWEHVCFSFQKLVRFTAQPFDRRLHAIGAAERAGRRVTGGRPQWRERQAGLLRYNCADSLDRTNAASYFIAVQVADPVGPRT